MKLINLLIILSLSAPAFGDVSEEDKYLHKRVEDVSTQAEDFADRVIGPHPMDENMVHDAYYGGYYYGQVCRTYQNCVWYPLPYPPFSYYVCHPYVVCSPW